MKTFTPSSYWPNHYRARLLRLEEGGPLHLALLMGVRYNPLEYRTGTGRGVLLLLDNNYAMVYGEVLPEETKALEVVPGEEGSTLLVSGSGSQ